MFSDPSKDFQDKESANRLCDIVSKPKSKLDIDDFIIIFQPFCTPGTTIETITYINPLFTFLRNSFFVEDFSSVMTLWENFNQWFSYHDKELEYSGDKKKIYREIEKLFGKMCEYGNNVAYESLYIIARKITQAVECYVYKCVPVQDKSICLLSILNIFQKNYILRELIILCMYYQACKQTKNNKKNILEVYSLQELKSMLNEITNKTLRLQCLPKDLDDFLVECEGYLMFEQGL